jgi:hypothetical protein
MTHNDLHRGNLLVHDREITVNYRQIYSFIYLLKYWDIEQLNEKQQDVLDQMRYRVENDIPYID